MTNKFYSVTPVSPSHGEYAVITDAFHPEVGSFYDVVKSGFQSEGKAQLYADRLNDYEKGAKIYTPYRYEISYKENKVKNIVFININSFTSIVDAVRVIHSGLLDVENHSEPTVDESILNLKVYVCGHEEDILFSDYTSYLNFLETYGIRFSLNTDGISIMNTYINGLPYDGYITLDMIKGYKSK